MFFQTEIENVLNKFTIEKREELKEENDDKDIPVTFVSILELYFFTKKTSLTFKSYCSQNDNGVQNNNQTSVLAEHGYFDQVTVNDYDPGHGIPPHVDTHSPFEEVFAALSLKSGATMHFKNP